jgi:hypothetical protein
MGLGMNFEQKGTFGLNHTKEITITIPIIYLFIYLFQKKINPKSFRIVFDITIHYMH